MTTFYLLLLARGSGKRLLLRAADQFRFTISSSHLLHLLLLNSNGAQRRLLKARLSACAHMRTCTMHMRVLLHTDFIAALHHLHHLHHLFGSASSTERRFLEARSCTCTYAPMHANTAAHKFRFTTSSSHLLHRLLLNSRRAEWRLLEARLSAFVHMRTCTHADASACTQILFRHFIISSSSSSPLLLKAQRGALLLSAFECVRAHMHPCTHECCCTQISFHHFIIFIFIFFLEARLSLSACAHMRTCTHAHTSGAAHKFRFTISSSHLLHLLLYYSKSREWLLLEARHAHMRTCTHAHQCCCTQVLFNHFIISSSSSSPLRHLRLKEQRVALVGTAFLHICAHWHAPMHTNVAAHKFRFTTSSSSSSSSSPLLLKEGRMALVGSAHMRTCTHAHTSAAAHKFRFTTSSSSMILHLLSHWKRVF